MKKNQVVSFSKCILYCILAQQLFFITALKGSDHKTKDLDEYSLSCELTDTMLDVPEQAFSIYSYTIQEDPIVTMCAAQIMEGNTEFAQVQIQLLERDLRQNSSPQIHQRTIARIEAIQDLFGERFSQEQSKSFQPQWAGAGGGAVDSGHTPLVCQGSNNKKRTYDVFENQKIEQQKPEFVIEPIQPPVGKRQNGFPQPIRRARDYLKRDRCPAVMRYIVKNVCGGLRICGNHAHFVGEKGIALNDRECCFDPKDRITKFLIDRQFYRFEPGDIVPDAGGDIYFRANAEQKAYFLQNQTGSQRIIPTDGPQGSKLFYRNGVVYSLKEGDGDFSPDRSELYMYLDIIHIVPQGGFCTDPQTGIHYVYSPPKRDNGPCVLKVLPNDAPVVQEGVAYFNYDGTLGRLENFQSLEALKSGTRYYNINGHIAGLPLYYNFKITPEMKKQLEELKVSAPLKRAEPPCTNADMDQRIASIVKNLNEKFPDKELYVKAVNDAFISAKEKGLIAPNQPINVDALVDHFIRSYSLQFVPNSPLTLEFWQDAAGFIIPAVIEYYFLPQGKILSAVMCLKLIYASLAGAYEFTHSTPEARAGTLAEILANFTKNRTIGSWTKDLFARMKIPQFKPVQVYPHEFKLSPMVKLQQHVNHDDMTYNFPEFLDNHIFLSFLDSQFTEDTLLFTLADSTCDGLKGRFEIEVNRRTKEIVKRRFIEDENERV